ncbi:phosphate ABC transporter substrate-binding protein [Oceanicoccus sp. KOV_DT_Chl]|uniref:phosphate ABC transporter substrate-binding protein n=1 Tax=Oceanicoccus sp. KOV_DT_Chl TaxID=1904639 RepID=UPI000C7D9570|nr:phosphate ABC transporter substrate-binding protein [Oceanicoccus sp. KOV_DT_Chl]
MLLSSQLFAGVNVVVHRDANIDAITPAQAANIFLGKTKNLPTGQLVIPIDQARTSTVRIEFYDKLINKNQNQLNAYWARQVFTGKSQPPNQVNDDDEIKLLIGNNPSMIGYMDSSNEDPMVKVILHIP